MAIKKYFGDRVSGLSSDAKPTNLSDGAIFTETDTLKIFLLVSGTWTELKAGLTGTKTYYVSDTSGGDTTRKLTFIDGILTAEE
jgi:hypothetical protein